MPRVIIVPTYYAAASVTTFEERTPDDVTEHTSFDAAIAYWQCEFGYGDPTLVDRSNGRYVVDFDEDDREAVKKAMKNNESQ